MAVVAPLPVLGMEEKQWCWRVASAELSISELETLSRNIISLVGMTADGPPDYAFYPNEIGKGGYGIQLYQKLTESFVVLSTWPDYGFLRITLASCMPYDEQQVTMFFEENIGKVLMQGGCVI